MANFWLYLCFTKAILIGWQINVLNNNLSCLGIFVDALQFVGTHDLVAVVVFAIMCAGCVRAYVCVCVNELIWKKKIVQKIVII